jgi:hypothetical protein
MLTELRSVVDISMAGPRLKSAKPRETFFIEQRKCAAPSSNEAGNHLRMQ